MKIGDKIRFVPYGLKFNPYTPNGRREVHVKIEGTIIGVNRAHHWYRVEYDCGGAKLHECFSYIPRRRKAHKPDAREIIAHYQKRAGA